MRKSALAIGSAALATVAVGGAVYVATAQSQAPAYDTTQREGVQYACVDEDGSLAYFQTRRPGDPGWSEAAYFCWDGEGGLTRWAFPYEAPPVDPGEEAPPTTETQPMPPTSDVVPSLPSKPEECRNPSFWVPECGDFEWDVRLAYSNGVVAWDTREGEIKSASFVVDGVEYEAEAAPPAIGIGPWTVKATIDGLVEGRRLVMNIEWANGERTEYIATLGWA